MSGVRSSLGAIEEGLERIGAVANEVASSAARGYEAQRVEPAPEVGGEVQAQVRDRVDISEQAVELMEAEQQVNVNIQVQRRLGEIQGLLMEIGE